MSFLHSMELLRRAQAQHAGQEPCSPLSAAEERARLQELARSHVDDDELVAGAYTDLDAALRAWSAGDLELDSVRSDLAGQRARVEQSLAAYEGTYLAPAEWTLASAFADQLLRDGHRCWLEGLELLNHHLRSGDKEPRSRGLAQLREGNRAFTLVERLALD